MKKHCLIVMIITCVVVLYSGVALAEEKPGADAKELWNYITTVDPYTEWGFWPDHKGLQPGRSPHGAGHKVFVNSAGLNSKMPPAAYGTIEVKENYSPDEKLMSITVMYKVSGYNPSDGDWFWAKYSPDGTVDKSGKPAGCIGCHGTRAANDFILVHDFN
ncbi:cytochrome P460 family protein [uncultured Pseudodesulfovibrio sp.]|uniref:cytochrome P460 family protein n=1 Tax=uncultured Pseudodesulfovibrio sp. TaxID=2035858 RepID=UPI0029C76DF7|nr:cytochrome P460 family protein [uncultured Pseudodesulfovibrio sp.]